MRIQRLIRPQIGHRFSDKSDAQTKTHRTEKWELLACPAPEPGSDKSDAKTKIHQTEKRENCLVLCPAIVTFPRTGAAPQADGQAPGPAIL
jgi:hypothetical protein